MPKQAISARRTMARFLFLILATTATPVQADGVACQSPESPTDTMVCSSKKLLTLNNQLENRYQAILESDHSLKQNQRDWSQQIRNRCPSQDCLLNAYENRIAYLDRYAALPALPAPSAAIADVSLDGGHYRLTAAEKSAAMTIAADFKTEWPYRSLTERVTECDQLASRRSRQAETAKNYTDMNALVTGVDSSEAAHRYLDEVGLIDVLALMELVLVENDKVIPFLERECDQLSAE